MIKIKVCYRICLGLRGIPNARLETYVSPEPEARESNLAIEVYE